MWRLVLAIGCPLILALLVGPMGFALSQLSETDEAGLYLALGTPQGLEAISSQSDVREIGPYRAPFARILYTPDDVHGLLVAQGYWILPASALAEVCGIQLNR